MVLTWTGLIINRLPKLRDDSLVNLGRIAVDRDVRGAQSVLLRHQRNL